MKVDGNKIEVTEILLYEGELCEIREGKKGYRLEAAGTDYGAEIRIAKATLAELQEEIEKGKYEYFPVPGPIICGEVSTYIVHYIGGDGKEASCYLLSLDDYVKEGEEVYGRYSVVTTEGKILQLTENQVTKTEQGWFLVPCSDLLNQHTELRLALAGLKKYKEGVEESKAKAYRQLDYIEEKLLEGFREA